MFYNSLNFHKLVRFQSDPPPGGNPPTGDPPVGDPPTQNPPAPKTTFTQDDVNAIMGKTRKEEREKARKEVEAEFLTKAEQEKADLEKKALEEQGQFKELSAKAQADKLKAEQEAKAARDEARTLKLEIEFDKAANRNKYQFVNEQAREDAFNAIDKTKIGEDVSADMDSQLKELNKSRSYYFGELEVVETDGSKRGKRPSTEQLTKERQLELSKRFPAVVRKPT